MLDELDKDTITKAGTTSNEGDNISEEDFYIIIWSMENYTKKDYKFVPLKLRLKRGSTVDKYLVYGYFVDDDYNIIEKMYLYVNLDNVNKTFSIERIKDETIDFENIQIENKEENIEFKYSNSYETFYISDEYISKKCFENLKYNLILNYKYIYENLDEEYKKAKFSDINIFKEYISNNIEKYKNMYLRRYSKETLTNGKTKYKFYNSYGDYYTVINEENNVKYKILLDNYTIFSDEEINNYKNASNKNKVYTDIQNFINMINNKDYISAYNVLDADFKDINSLTLENFKDYIKEKLFDYNVISSSSDFGESEDSQFIMTIIVKNRVAVAADQKEVRFIVTLGENTNFKIAILD